jgi:hypothetical protein
MPTQTTCRGISIVRRSMTDATTKTTTNNP